jgi:hypothetical protein
LDRKYRQPGYQDRSQDREKEREHSKPRERGPKMHRPEFRSPRMPGFQEVMRCSSCGKELPTVNFEITFTTKCPKCSAALHVCKNCVSFDTSSRFECRQVLKERVARKDESNLCTLFEARRMLERQTGSTPVNTPRDAPDDPRAAFERLFKK